MMEQQRVERRNEIDDNDSDDDDDGNTQANDNNQLRSQQENSLCDDEVGVVQTEHKNRTGIYSDLETHVSEPTNSREHAEDFKDQKNSSSTYVVGKGVQNEEKNSHIKVPSGDIPAKPILSSAGAKHDINEPKSNQHATTKEISHDGAHMIDSGYVRPSFSSSSKTQKRITSAVSELLSHEPHAEKAEEANDLHSNQRAWTVVNVPVTSQNQTVTTVQPRKRPAPPPLQPLPPPATMPPTPLEKDIPIVKETPSNGEERPDHNTNRREDNVKSLPDDLAIPVHREQSKGNKSIEAAIDTESSHAVLPTFNSLDTASHNSGRVAKTPSGVAALAVGGAAEEAAAMANTASLSTLPSPTSTRGLRRAFAVETLNVPSTEDTRAKEDIGEGAQSSNNPILLRREIFPSGIEGGETAIQEENHFVAVVSGSGSDALHRSASSTPSLVPQLTQPPMPATIDKPESNNLPHAVVARTVSLRDSAQQSGAERRYSDERSLSQRSASNNQPLSTYPDSSDADTKTFEQLHRSTLPPRSADASQRQSIEGDRERSNDGRPALLPPTSIVDDSNISSMGTGASAPVLMSPNSRLQSARRGSYRQHIVAEFDNSEEGKDALFPTSTVGHHMNELRAKNDSNKENTGMEPTMSEPPNPSFQSEQSDLRNFSSQLSAQPPARPSFHGLSNVTDDIQSKDNTSQVPKGFETLGEQVDFGAQFASKSSHPPIGYQSEESGPTSRQTHSKRRSVELDMFDTSKKYKAPEQEDPDKRAENHFAQANEEFSAVKTNHRVGNTIDVAPASFGVGALKQPGDGRSQQDNDAARKALEERFATLTAMRDRMNNQPSDVGSTKQSIQQVPQKSEQVEFAAPTHFSGGFGSQYRSDQLGNYYLQKKKSRFQSEQDTEPLEAPMAEQDTENIVDKSTVIVNTNKRPIPTSYGPQNALDPQSFKGRLTIKVNNLDTINTELSVPYEEGTLPTANPLLAACSESIERRRKTEELVKQVDSRRERGLPMAQEATFINKGAVPKLVASHTSSILNESVDDDNVIFGGDAIEEENSSGEELSVERHIGSSRYIMPSHIHVPSNAHPEVQNGMEPNQFPVADDDEVDAGEGFEGSSDQEDSHKSNIQTEKTFRSKEEGHQNDEDRLMKMRQQQLMQYHRLYTSGARTNTSSSSDRNPLPTRTKAIQISPDRPVAEDLFRPWMRHTAKGSERQMGDPNYDPLKDNPFLASNPVINGSLANTVAHASMAEHAEPNSMFESGRTYVDDPALAPSKLLDNLRRNNYHSDPQSSQKGKPLPGLDASEKRWMANEEARGEKVLRRLREGLQMTSVSKKVDLQPEQEDNENSINETIRFTAAQSEEIKLPQPHEFHRQPVDKLKPSRRSISVHSKEEEDRSPFAWRYRVGEEERTYRGSHLAVQGESKGYEGLVDEHEGIHPDLPTYAVGADNLPYQVASFRQNTKQFDVPNKDGRKAVNGQPAGAKKNELNQPSEIPNSPPRYRYVFPHTHLTGANLSEIAWAHNLPLSSILRLNQSLASTYGANGKLPKTTQVRIPLTADSLEAFHTIVPGVATNIVAEPTTTPTVRRGPIKAPSLSAVMPKTVLTSREANNAGYAVASASKQEGAVAILHRKDEAYNQLSVSPIPMEPSDPPLTIEVASKQPTLHSLVISADSELTNTAKSTANVPQVSKISIPTIIHEEKEEDAVGKSSNATSLARITPRSSIAPSAIITTHKTEKQAADPKTNVQKYLAVKPQSSIDKRQRDEMVTAASIEGKMLGTNKGPIVFPKEVVAVPASGGGGALPAPVAARKGIITSTSSSVGSPTVAMVIEGRIPNLIWSESTSVAYNNNKVNSMGGPKELRTKTGSAIETGNNKQNHKTTLKYTEEVTDDFAPPLHMLRRDTLKAHDKLQQLTQPRPSNQPKGFSRSITLTTPIASTVRLSKTTATTANVPARATPMTIEEIALAHNVHPDAIYDANENILVYGRLEHGLYKKGSSSYHFQEPLPGGLVLTIPVVEL